MSFWSELKRRNVFKVGAAYVIVAWLLAQIVSLAFPAFHMPQWTVTFVMSLLILGLPVTLIIAWAFELTPEGVKLTKDVPKDESITHLTGQKLNYILIGVIVLGVAYILFDNFYLDKLAIQTEVESRVAELAPTTVKEEEAVPTTRTIEDEETLKTIAVLPFDDLSPDSDQGYFVNGLSEDISSFLNQIPGLIVTGMTSSFSFKGSNKTAQEIGGILGAKYILYGSVRKAGNALKIIAKLVRTEDGANLFIKPYDRTWGDIFAIQGEIATAIADELKVTLGVGESLKQLGGTDDVEAYQLYLIAKGQYRDIEHERALLSINEAISLDQEFALAWVLKSQILGAIAFNSSDDQWALFLEPSTNAAHKAIELEPKLAAGYFALGLAKTGALNWLEAQLAFNKALEYTADPLLRYEIKDPFFYSVVGHLEKAKIMLEEFLLNDPLNIIANANYIDCLAIMGDYQGAEEEYEKGKILLNNPDFAVFDISHARLFTNNVFSSDDLPYSSPIFNVVKDHLKSPKDALIELNRIYRDDNNLTVWDMMDISLWAAYFGDSEFAVEAMKKAVVHRFNAIGSLWAPVFQKVRQLPQFKEIVREIGLVDYWEQFGWPDICRPLDNGDFVCD